MDLTKFLKKYQVKNHNYNYVLLTQPTGKYYIPDTVQDTEYLHNTIIYCEENNIDFGICECHEEDLSEPLYYDLDFSLLVEAEISDDLICSMIGIINESIQKFFSISPDSLNCFVTRKENYIEKRITEGYYHVGIHLMYPFVRSAELGRRLVYNKIIKDVKKANLFEHLKLYEERIDQIIDHRVIKTNSILKFGCNKPGKQRYVLYKIFDSELKEVPTTYSKKELLNLLSIRSNLWASNKIETNFKPTIDIEKYKEELLLEMTVKKEHKTYKDATKKDKNILDFEHIERIKKLVGMLSLNRANYYETWIQVGLCLHNISDSNEMLEIWKDWSLKVPQKANKTNFTKVWKTFKQRDDGLKIGTLTLWAREDNEKEFLLFKLDEIDKRIKISIDGNTSYDIAKVLREMYDGVYVCSSLKTKTCYEFRKHNYVEIQEAYTLFINISEELVREYQRKEIDIEQKCLELRRKILGNEVYDTQLANNEIDQQTAKVSAIKKLIEKLKDSNFKLKVMTDARTLFYDEEFEKKLNESRNLLVFKNGVYDLDKREFRNGRPEDYMSFTTDINYIEHSETDPDIQKIYHIFSQIHPNEENRFFFFTTLAAGLHGLKKEQKLDIWTGTGSNGKSVTIDFLSKSLGDYFDSPPITMLTRKRGGSANASPDLAKLKGKRIVSFLEPEYNDTLHTSMMKQFFGNDWIEARGLFKDPIKFKPQSSGFLACNDLPNIPTNDGGTWRRIRVLEFKSKFVHNPKQPFEYKIDPKLTEQIDQLAEAFMSLLIHYWCKFYNSGFVIKEPEDVREFTKKYQTECDIYLEFIDDCIEKTDDEKDRLTFKSVLELFKQWYKDNVNVGKPPGKAEIKKQLEFKMGELPINNRGWMGRKFKEVESFS